MMLCSGCEIDEIDGSRNASSRSRPRARGFFKITSANAGLDLEPPRIDPLETDAVVSPLRSADLGSVAVVERISRPMALRQASAERGGSREATAGAGWAGCDARFERAEELSRPGFSRRRRPALKPLFSRAVRTVAWNAVRGCGCRCRATRRVSQLAKRQEPPEVRQRPSRHLAVCVPRRLCGGDRGRHRYDHAPLVLRDRRR